MRLYIKGDFTKKITFGYEDLAHKMWFDKRNGKELSLSHSGNDEMLQEDFYSWLTYPKWLNDDLWNSTEIVNLHSFFRNETIGMEFEDAFQSDYRERGECLRIASSHKDILTIDKRAMYIMVVEVASIIDGQISEDDKGTWMTVEAFKKRHEDILSLTFEEANKISLEEVFVMKPEADPIWDELDRRREEYIKIHGERVWDDD